MTLFVFRDFELDHELRRNGVPVPLEPLHYALLYHLVSNGGEVVTRRQLGAVWGEPEPSDATINSAICRIRRAIAQEPGNVMPLEALYKRGYRFHGAKRVSPRPPTSAVSWSEYVKSAAQGSNRTAEECIAMADAFAAAEAARFSVPG